jgi:hypothetical protein
MLCFFCLTVGVTTRSPCKFVCSMRVHGAASLRWIAACIRRCHMKKISHVGRQCTLRTFKQWPLLFLAKQPLHGVLASQHRFALSYQAACVDNLAVIGCCAGVLQTSSRLFLLAATC